MDDYRRFGIRVDKIDMGLSFGMCISYDKVCQRVLPIYQSYQMGNKYWMANI